MHGHAFNDPIIPRYIRTYVCVSMSVYMLVCDMCECAGAYQYVWASTCVYANTYVCKCMQYTRT